MPEGQMQEFSSFRQRGSSLAVGLADRREGYGPEWGHAARTLIRFIFILTPLFAERFLMTLALNCSPKRINLVTGLLNIKFRYICNVCLRGGL